MALNSAAMAWGERAKLAREMGNDQEAQSCERIRRQHGELWDRIDAAQRALEAAPPAKCGYVGCSICDADA
jgi:hypothetical protein